MLSMSQPPSYTVKYGIGSYVFNIELNQPQTCLLLKKISAIVLKRVQSTYTRNCCPQMDTTKEYNSHTNNLITTLNTTRLKLKPDENDQDDQLKQYSKD